VGHEGQSPESTDVAPFASRSARTRIEIRSNGAWARERTRSSIRIVLDRSPLDGPPDANVSALSRREVQVLQMAVLGKTNPAIATELGISVHAIKFHMASIYRKLGVANRTEAAVVFLQHLEPRT